MGLCASKEVPYEANKTSNVNIDTLPDSIVDVNNTNDQEMKAAAKTAEHKNRAQQLYAKGNNESSVQNPRPSTPLKNVTTGVSERVTGTNSEKNTGSTLNFDSPKKLVLGNPNVKVSTSKLMQQATDRSGLSMSQTRNLSGIQSPLANIQNPPTKEDTYKVLLLGVGESGKSTVLKQFKVLHQGGYNEEELLKMRPVIFKNLIDISNDIFKAREKYKIPVSENDIKNLKDSIPSFEDYRDTLTLSMKNRKDYIKKSGPLEDIEVDDIINLPTIFFAYLAILWKAAPTQALLKSKHRKNFHLLGNAQYFIDNLKRISNPDYVPTVDDVLKSRNKTTGIQETTVEMKDEHITLNICDVGGQRVERKKWIYCFSNVSILIFCVSLSDYDSPLEEDSKVNALTESIQLFDSIVNSKWFANTQVMLFLNKIDIFLKKIPHSPLNAYFPGYDGDPKDAKASVKYILSLLKERNHSNLTIYPHVTQATDSSNIELVFATLAETVLENRIKNLGAI